MQSEDLLKLGQKFLEYAKDDIVSAEILLRSGTTKGVIRNALFHMQQAGEKILKSVAYSLMIDKVYFLYSTTTQCVQYYGQRVPHRYRNVQKFLANVSRLRDPKSLGHSLRSFIEDFLRQFINYSSSGELRGFIVWFYDSCFPETLKKNLRPHQYAEDIITALRELYGMMYRLNVHESYLERLSSYALHLGVSAEVKAYDELLKKIKSLVNQGACLAPCLEVYEAIDGSLSKLAENEKFKNLLNLLNSLSEDLVNQLMPIVLNTLSRFMKLDENAVKRYLMKVFTEVVSQPRLFILLGKHSVPFHIIPLHVCLTKYERSSRYPDEGGIPDEDLEPQTLGKVLEALKNIHREVEEVIGLQLKLYGGSDHNCVNA